MRTGRGHSIAPRALAAPPRLRRFGFGFSSGADSFACIANHCRSQLYSRRRCGRGGRTLCEGDGVQTIADNSHTHTYTLMGAPLTTHNTHL
jgi:hypothetical protein